MKKLLVSGTAALALLLTPALVIAKDKGGSSGEGAGASSSADAGGSSGSMGEGRSGGGRDGGRAGGQDGGRDGGRNGGRSGGAVNAQDVTGAVDGQRAGQVSFGNLISALNNVNVQVDRLNALNDLTVQDITVVDASNLARGARVNALNNALNRNDIDVLTQSLNNNDVIKNVLNNSQIAVTDVIAVNVLSGGDVVLFTK